MISGCNPIVLISGDFNAFVTGYNSCGVYGISGLFQTESFETPIYVGSAKDMQKRLEVYHFRSLKGDFNGNQPLQHYCNKHGMKNVIFFQLEFCPKEDLLKTEQKYIDYYGIAARGEAFNICPKAGNTLGVKASEETKKKMSENRIGEKNSFWGKKHSEETLKKQRELRKGIPLKLSEESLAKKIAANLTHGEKTAADFYLKSPDGAIVRCHNITKFCKEKNLGRTGISGVHTGRLKTHKGWTKFIPLS